MTKIQLPIFIDVGVHLGEDSLDKNDHFVFGFEPDITLYNALKDKIQKEFVFPKNYKLYNYAVDSEETEKEMILSHPGRSSLNTFSHNKVWEKRWDVYPTKEQIKVKTIRLDSLVKAFSLEKIDYLHVDAQGNDLKVLESLGGYIEIVKKGQIEAAKNEETKLYLEQPTQTDCLCWLLEYGFSIDSITQNDFEDGGLGAEVNIFFSRN